MPAEEYDLFHIGDIVKITGLKTIKYNGELAEIAGPFLIDTKRWPIKVRNDDQDKLAVKSVNLQRTMPSSYAPSYSSGIYGIYYITQTFVYVDNEGYIEDDDDDKQIQYATAEDFKDYFHEDGDDEKGAQTLYALQRKYSSKKVILPEKRKTTTPQCFECNGFYHIQSDPISAYDQVGIICELCGKNKTDNPELLLEDHYYKCETCESVDICSKCYEKEKKKIMNHEKPTQK